MLPTCPFTAMIFQLYVFPDQNEKFVQNADEDVVAADRELLENSKRQIAQLQDALIRFQ